MLEKLELIYQRWKTVEGDLSSPDAMADMKRFAQMNKEYKDLAKIVDQYNIYKNIMSNIDSNKEILATEKDDEFREMAKAELDELLVKQDEMEEVIRLMLIPKDPEDSKNAMIEIRGGTGGDEASLFAGDLYRMYMRYCERRGWKTELVDYTEGTAGGYKEIVFSVNAEDAYGNFKYESGVHRVQRVPDTETQGRVHTSAASVVVLPEVDEFDIDLQVSDIRKDLFCSSGPGGQSVNTTYSAVRLTHIPTGIVAQCQDQKSQLKNYDKALGVLRSRVYEMELQKHLEETSKRRKTMVATGDRSAKVRTYNYPQGRLTEHRIGLTIYNLTGVMNGDLQEIMEALQFAENAERLKEGTAA
ncbi:MULTISPECIES: peptide chain release factor 1 [Mucilaginibacter]|uniref:peptide chain release factor 1 n=1 Tax=Mucilaginibacter TaxID=423349 RepID=UPI002090CA82|nr:MULTISPECIES: peptide chain release factor 1 [Mucilaginibacter]MEB0249403.1 peptide chain release factor 1 [Mucilaginibacter sp. 5B2]MCO5936636.1 peptide chain release factor 1 [Mucilaginibacter aurantiaciroseus]MEB0263473.1 peptide chain release factor 1 [Mucilaginibacter sp. 10I4]MEB0279645.1 peptide chain release factor 1 [Mucilaginibacter sp. 10B2]MEB0302378.1 peptide chain release factor 1 [Mucilaginibacter sp. 5C4]